LHFQTVKERFSGELWTQDADAEKKYGINRVQSVAKPGLSTDKNIIHQGENSGYQAINLAYHLGVKRILLLGYDMGYEGQRHFFGEHPQPLGQSSDYPKLRKNFSTIIPDEYGIEIYNCSP